MSRELAKELFDYFLTSFQLYRLDGIAVFAAPEAFKEESQIERTELLSNQAIFEQLNRAAQSNPLEALETLLRSGRQYFAIVASLPGRFSQTMHQLLRAENWLHGNVNLQAETLIVNDLLARLPEADIQHLNSVLTFAMEYIDLPDERFIDAFGTYMENLS